MRSVKELMGLNGRVALVAGGGGHIGAALCHALGELGASIAVLDISEEAAASVAAQIEDAYGGKAVQLVVDLSDTSKVRAIPDWLTSRFGRLDILVNCAALVGTSKLPGWSVPFLEQSPETFAAALEVNLVAAFLLTQTCVPALLRSTHGSVINIASIHGMVGPDMRLYEGTGMGNPAAYAASKGGLLQLTRWLATVLAPTIRVNAVTPGGIWRSQPAVFHERYVARTPLGRMGREEDLKGAVAYLASDLSAYVTGHNLVVDGGWIAW
jgi:NAD(P)-dependent dehydrogenase (short-subunit alcohol dehydrogenase family)